MAKRGRGAWKRQADEFRSRLGGYGSLDDAFGRAAIGRAERDAYHDALARDKACSSKNRYLDEEDALEALEACERHGRRNLRIYRCPYCDGWHLTSKPQR